MTKRNHLLDLARSRVDKNGAGVILLSLLALVVLSGCATVSAGAGSPGGFPARPAASPRAQHPPGWPALDSPHELLAPFLA
jgi:hypothetical protein